MTRLGEIASLAGISAVASVAVSVYGIAPYTTYAAWCGIGFTAVSAFAVACSFRLTRV